jgi:hypothetical protein
MSGTDEQTLYTYTARKPPLPEPVEDLRARIPGWGADLDPADRPSVPREQDLSALVGARWEFPERQAELRPRERSIEHAGLTPAFGTSCPTRGLSGAIRRYAYRRHGEAKAAHWLLLIAADRVDVAESRVRDALHGRPDRLVAETGVAAEVPAHGLRSRLGRHRSDVVHHPMDPVVVAAPWVLGGWAAYAVARRLARRHG